jgi:hypothetical protein
MKPDGHWTWQLLETDGLNEFYVLYVPLEAGMRLASALKMTFL